MCGIFGIVTDKFDGQSTKQLRSCVASLLELSESRGKEAAGLALSYRDRIQVLKRPYSASELIRSDDYQKFFESGFPYSTNSTQPREAFALIGHSRLVTNGTSSFHQNNQPVICDGVVGIHNGIVVNDLRLWSENPDLRRNYEVDTEVILALIRRELNQGKSLRDSTVTTFGRIEGAASIATLFQDLNAVLLATNNGSLYLGSDRAGKGFVFASEEQILRSFLKRKRSELGEYSVRRIAPGSGCIIYLDDLSHELFQLRVCGTDTALSGRTPQTQPRQIIDLGEARADRVRKLAPDLPTVTVRTVPDEFVKRVEQTNQAVAGLRRCSRCVLPETMPFITFDSDGVCSYCRIYRPVQLRGRAALDAEVNKFRSVNGKLDCCVALSGGRDSTYGLHYISRELGLNPIAYTYDWGMVTDLARRNISRICGKLGVEHVLVSANIRMKRENIRKNVSAWLRQPDLGMIPLFMAGDKQFYYHANRLKNETNVARIIFCECPLETTNFKTGFCGTAPRFGGKQAITLPFYDKMRLLWYYLSRFVGNPAYLNQSLVDSFLAYCSYYIIPHDYLFLFHYIPWVEEELTHTLATEYGWETAGDTKQTWRIGDGTAAFYNYIYYNLAGFTENDTFRSNQIREGLIGREQALALVRQENQPRWTTIQEYLSLINVDFVDAIRKINSVDPRFSL